ncbi:MAG: VWA domain-containing protein [Bryobacteraceae bacterium]|nr:VWA domain-containing protein [Bryobacteraceae bacterium]
MWVSARLVIAAMALAASAPASDPAIIDLVLRDSKGHRLDDVALSDLALRDNGKPVELVELRKAATASPRRVVILLEPMTLEPARRAAGTAVELVKLLRPAGASVAVLQAGSPLRVLQPFTDDIAAVRRAIFEGVSRREPEGGPGVQPDSILAAALRYSEQAHDELPGVPVLNAVYSAARALQSEPGHKTLVYFSEGLTVPAALNGKFHAVEAVANRARLSVYTADASGVVSSGRATALGDLAAATGGLHCEKQGDLGPFVERVAEDVAGHFELLYRGLPAAGDGTFHELELTSTRPKLAVQMPTRYCDLPAASSGFPVSGELSRSAERSNLPIDFPVFVALKRFSGNRMHSLGIQRTHSSFGGAAGGGIRTQEGGPDLVGTVGPLQMTVFVEVPFAGIRFVEDGSAGYYAAHLSLLALVKDAAGRVVHRFERDAPLKGPLRKLDIRKQGSYYLARSVALPPGEYSVECVVEDKLSQKSSGTRTRVKVERALPGFHMSDVFFVRKYDGSRDRMDADSVLSYDGNALSPVLEPSIREKDEARLDVYFLLYPDIYGDPPKLGLEIFRDGQAIGRGDLPFTDRLLSVEQRSEQKHQFPYLTSLNIRQFSAGSYEARVTGKQGFGSFARSLLFRVERVPGAPEAPEDRTVLARREKPGQDGEEAEGDAVPEVLPVKVEATGAGPDAAERERILEDVRLFALSYTKRLPNFRCRQVTRRLVGAGKKGEPEKESDVIVEQLTFENGRETYATLEINGEKSDRDREEWTGVRSRGEFGTLLRAVFKPETQAKFAWEGWTMLNGERHHVFRFDIAEDKSFFVFNHNGRQEVAAVTGRVFVEEVNTSVTRLQVEGDIANRKFPIQSPSLALDYGPIRIGDFDHTLPVSSVLQLKQGKRLVRNEAVFRDYRKYSSDIKVTFDP